jgi:putative phage-type endonuclease
MTLTEYAKVEQGSPEWHDLRRGLVTASTVGRLLTASTIKPASNDESRGLTALLVSERITGWTEPTWANADMMRGVECEPIARDIYSAYYQQATETGFMVREEDGWTLGYSPDGLVGTDGLIEIKAPRPKTHLQTILSDAVPTYHLPQIQAGLLVTGRKWLDFVSFVGGMPLFVKRVYPDPVWFEAIETACRRFEDNAAVMVATYRDVTRDAPMTERIDYSLGLVF